MSNQEPPKKKRRLDAVATENEDFSGSVLDAILQQTVDEIFGNRTISDVNLQKVSLKLSDLQREATRRLQISQTLSLSEKMNIGVTCTRAYVGDGDGSVEYEGLFVVGPNEIKLYLSFSGQQDSVEPIKYCGVYLGEDPKTPKQNFIWNIEDVETEPMQLYYSSAGTRRIIETSGFNVDSDNQAMNGFAEELSNVCLRKFRQNSRKHWIGSVDFNFDFSTLWSKRKDFVEI